MLYEWLAAPSGAFNLLNYITFRTGAAVVTAFLVTVIFGDVIINALRARQGKGQPIRDLSLEAQMSKKGTPTMGGLLIWLGLIVGVALWGNLANPYVWVTLFVTFSFAFLG
ncbi:MAG: phospho-N-acetylmuramoyl-pentapeptide-transferase, partial [Hyphomonas sp.]